MLDLAASGAGKIALVERLELQDEGKIPASPQPLLEDVGCHPKVLPPRDCHLPPPVRYSLTTPYASNSLYLKLVGRIDRDAMRHSRVHRQEDQDGIIAVAMTGVSRAGGGQGDTWDAHCLPQGRPYPDQPRGGRRGERRDLRV